MALKPTIYKFSISISDLNRDLYDSVSLTVALHPSETIERMMARIITYCLNLQTTKQQTNQQALTFTKGLSEVDEPDLWLKSLDDQILLWIELGEPSFDRIKKAYRNAKAVKVYSYNSKSDTWWQQNKNQFNRLPVEVTQFDAQSITLLSEMLERSMSISVTITGDSAYVATAKGEIEVTWNSLQFVT